MITEDLRAYLRDNKETMSTTTTLPILPREELLERAENVRQSLASLRLEGLAATPETLALADQYARGELTLDQFSAALHENLERSLGPLPLPRD